MSNNFRLRITNHRKIFFNYTRDIACFSCEKDLHDSYTVSGNRGKTRCVPCAVKYHIIDEVPEEIKELIWYGFKTNSRCCIYRCRYGRCCSITIHNHRISSKVSTYRTLRWYYHDRKCFLLVRWIYGNTHLHGISGNCSLQVN